MPSLFPPTPTLLAPAKPASPPAQAEQADTGFSDELSKAVRPDQPNDTKGKDQESAERDETPPSASVDANAEAEQEPSDGVEEALPEEASSEESLLAVSVVTETLVVETSPNAELPAEAGTQLEVSNPTGEASVTDYAFAGVPNEAVDPGRTTAETTLPPAPTNGEAELTETGASQDESTLFAVDLNAEAEGEGEGDSSTMTEEPSGTNESESNTDAEDIESYEEFSFKAVSASAGATAADPDAISVAAAAENALQSPPADEAESEPSRPANAPATPTLEVASELGAEAESEAAPRPGSNVATNASSTSRPTLSSSLAEPAPEPLPTIDPARFVSRVARAFDFAQERGGGPIEMRLSPPELGSLQVKIELREGVLTAALEAETPAARQTLLDNLPALRDRLEQQQIRIDKFDVDVRDDSQQRGGDWQPDGEARRDDADGGSPERREPVPDARTDEESAADPTRTTTTATIDFGSDEINLVA